MIPRNLYLAQHAEYNGIDKDPAEGLSDEGIYHTQNLLTFLKTSLIVPDYILCSPKTRSRQTAEILRQGETEVIETEKMKPLTSAEETLEVIPENGEHVLLVGHLPNLQEIAKYLGADIEFEMAGLGYFSSGRLKWYITPTIIRMAI